MHYEDHQITSGLPLMDKNDLKDLAERIKSRGLHHRIILFEDKILDGRNRYRACVLAGVDPKFENFEDKHPDENPWEFVWDENEARLHKDKGQRAACSLLLEKGSDKWEAERERREEEANKARSKAAKGNRNAAKDRPKNSRCSKRTATGGEAKTRKARAKRAGVGESTMAKTEVLERNAPDLFKLVAAGKMKLAKAMKVYKQRKREEAMRKAREQAKAQDLTDRFKVYHCSMKELFESMAAERFTPNAVISDPPYPEKYIHLYGELAKLCADAKIAVVAVMCPHTYLREILNMMCEHLTYRWTIAYLEPGGQAATEWEANVNITWKPVLLFGDRTKRIGDVVNSAINDSDKNWHHWGQSESGMAQLVNRLTEPGQWVCDPFMGGGTTAIACLKSTRKFIGCDIEQKNVENTRLRLGL